MPGMRHNSTLQSLIALGCLGIATSTMVPMCVAQSQSPSKGVAAATEQGTVLDKVVATVNGDVILESDVDEERRFESIQPYRGSATEFSRERAVQRLIDRALILQQAESEPEGIIS
jgi:hypothetical protein